MSLSAAIRRPAYIAGTLLSTILILPAFIHSDTRQRSLRSCEESIASKAQCAFEAIIPYRLLFVKHGSTAFFCRQKSCGRLVYAH